MKSWLFKFTVNILWTSVAAIMFCSMTTVYSQAYDFQKYVDVGLRYGNTAVNLAVIDSNQSLSFGTINGDAFNFISDLQGNQSVSAEVSEGKIKISDSKGNVLETIDNGLTCCIMVHESEDAGILRFNNVSYRGGILLKQNASGKITVINRLEPEAYLYGVLHQEMSQGNPIEALKAQAIAARNFMAVRIGSHSSDGFDLCTTTHCQVYKGFSGEYAKTNQAVDETAGQLMFSDGNPIQAYYHKNSGGYTENSENVWYSALPYLRAVADSYSPAYPWTAAFSASEVQSIMSSAGYTIGTFKGASIKGKSSAGGVLSMEILGDQGTVLLEKEKIRSVFGATVVKSLNYQLSGSDNQIIAIQGGGTIEVKSADVSVLSRDGTINQLNINGLYVTNGDETIQLEATAIPQDGIGFNGLGYGHRLGMSQDGAIAMANQGFDYQTILKFYYTNIEIR